MADPGPPTPEEVVRLVRQYLQSLQAAGVDWLPRVALEAVPSPALASGAVAPPVLFAEDAPVPLAIAAEDLSLEQRRHALTVLAAEVATCTRCPELAATRTQTVFGIGPVGAELCLIGEAPGADEDAQGFPFVGEAGQLLNRILAACGLKREQVYICNTLKCRPPGNRSPLAPEMANCREYLERQLELVQPRFICALGGAAAKTLLNTTLSMARLRRRFHDYKGIPVLCTYHPAYLLPHRNPQMKREVWEDMKFLMARMGRTIPAQGR